MIKSATASVSPGAASPSRRGGWDYLVVLALILASGSPLITSLGPEAIYIPVFAMLFLATIVQRTAFAYRDLLAIAAFLGIAMVHVASFGMGVIPASLGFLIKIAIALMAVRLVREFAISYVTVMSALALLSLVFFVPYKSGLDLPGILASWNIGNPADGVNVGFHNYQWDPGRIRNSGVFWEPGAFAGYLLLAALFVVCEPGKMAWSRFAILAGTILTTESTMGYAGLAVVAVMLIYRMRKEFDRFLRAIVFPTLLIALVAGAIGAYNELPFLREKIEHQLSEVSIERGRYEANRFGNLLYDIRYIVERPVFGWSPWLATRGEEASELAMSQGNGMSGFALRYGATGVVVYFVTMLFAYWSYSKNFVLAGAACLVVALALMGEQFLNFPIFLTLMFRNMGK